MLGFGDQARELAPTRRGRPPGAYGGPTAGVQAVQTALALLAAHRLPGRVVSEPATR